MSVEPSVSVVVATNRSGPFFDEALGSVALQTRQPLEVIVVDDGAEDPAAIERAAAAVPRARIIHRRAAGVSAARNVGAAAARGDLLVFLDDDDRWAPERLERQAEALASHPEAAASYCGMRSIDEHGQVVADADQRQVPDALSIARRSVGIILPNLMVRRSALIAAGGFHAGMRMAEDLDLILRLAQLGRFVCVPEALVDYRAHASNTTGRHRELVAGIDRVLQLHLGLAEDAGREELAAALRESLQKNRRFAWWGAARAARRRWSQEGPVSAAGELGWAARTAPSGLVDGAARQLIRRLRRRG
ncbi:glycosyltransferase [Nesterenkonia sp. NBAIMH1]|uniref:glycosyltransferase n=1 Tax=Nesterenkonia sp. NBAIMH1 TaxID=2600320 RepID=UPI00143D7767|nr:glycosyltransferase [Nesterenkonia sp. NBAIMH1]